MEILVVVAIILVLASSGFVFYQRYQDDAKLTMAKQGVKALETVVETYKMKNHDYPSDLSALLQPDDTGKPYVSADALRTPWGGQYQFNPSGPRNNGFKPDIWAEAPNGVQIGNW
jgi:type II secretory pathway pseudopilin PulG